MFITTNGLTDSGVVGRFKPSCQHWPTQHNIPFQGSIRKGNFVVVLVVVFVHLKHSEITHEVAHALVSMLKHCDFDTHTHTESPGIHLVSSGAKTHG